MWKAHPGYPDPPRLELQMVVNLSADAANPSGSPQEMNSATEPTLQPSTP